jgi:hypothetical protein
MTDEDKKRIVSEPPPPTDEIDGEWGDDDQTLIREVPEGVSRSQPVPPSAETVGQTAAAPISTPERASAAAARAEEDEEEEEDEDEEEEEETDNEDDEDEDEEDAAHAEPPATPAPSNDWIPEWAPFAVLGLLVTASIVFGLGLVGGEAPPADEADSAAPAASALAPAKKPSPHP